MRRIVGSFAALLVCGLLVSAVVGCAPTSSTSGGGSGATTPAPSDSGPAAQLPAAPAEVSGVQDWLKSAYPSAAWFSRIKKITYVKGEVPDSGGFANAIVVTTDLDYASEQELAKQIAAALGTANVTWAKQYVIWFGDGSNELAGDLAATTP